jgi:hypothetical protein
MISGLLLKKLSGMVFTEGPERERRNGQATGSEDRFERSALTIGLSDRFPVAMIEE